MSSALAKSKDDEDDDEEEKSCGSNDESRVVGCCEGEWPKRKTPRINNQPCLKLRKTLLDSLWQHLLVDTIIVESPPFPKSPDLVILG